MKLYIYIIPLLLIISCGKSINNEQILFNVERGDSISRVANNLKTQNILHNTLSFRILAKITGKEKKIKFGAYSIPPKTSVSKILKIITSGIGINIPITIKEGLNIFEIAAILEDRGIVSSKKFFTAASSPENLAKFHILPSVSKPITNIERFCDLNGNKYSVPQPMPILIEGYLFPDTYYLTSNMNGQDVINIMTKKFDDIISKENIKKKASEKGWSINKLITFASIIQKEAGSIEEMPKVAGVYCNRIKKQMKLQADPTIIYSLLLDNEYRGNIRTKHVKPPWPSPYNTYYRKSFPPGPIANPGKEAILAALYPEKHNYIFFVRDPDGSHTYTSNLEEHNKAVQKWVNYKRKAR